MNFLLIAILSVVAQLAAPWYIIAVVPFLVFLWNPGRSRHAFWISFGAIALPWAMYAYYLHFISDSAMSDRIAGVFSLPAGLLLIPISALIAGLTGGFAGAAGYWARRIFTKEVQ